MSGETGQLQRLTDQQVNARLAAYNPGGSLDRDIELRIARLAFGDSTVRRRTLDDDPQLRKAIEIVQKSASQKDLFALVASRPQR